MSTLLEDRPDRRTQKAPATTAADLDLAVRVVDRGLHLGGLLVHALVYLGLGVVASQVDFGPHLLAGFLFGDFAGYCLRSLHAFRAAPVATAAEFALFAVLFVLWWRHYSWSPVPEFRALFFLAAFGALTGRVGMLAGQSRGSGWD